ncbi:hypothetical protein ACTG15_01075 [Aeromonas sp. 164P]
MRVYADLAHWEIQQRLRRKEIGNWGAGNEEEDILRRYKRAFFIEWRVFDRHKLTSCPPSISCSTPTPGTSRPW